MRLEDVEEEQLHHHDEECDDPDCGCHEHHHHDHHDHHDHHEHHHHHDHDHDEECDDPDCECHEHHHHDSAHEDHDLHGVKVTTHDSAMVGSVACRIPLPYDEAVSAVEEKLHDVAEQVQKQGGFIGHIKGLVKGAAPQCRISITDEMGADVQKFAPVDASEAECVCIVFGVSREALKNLIEDSFSEWL
jgi:hypothetical protein